MDSTVERKSEAVEKEVKLKMYKAEYIDDSFEIIIAESDNEALAEAYSNETQAKHLVTLYEVNDEYEELRQIF